MTIRTLESINLNVLLDTFNLSFSDYFVPFKLSMEQLEYKILSEHIDLSISVGAFSEENLIGFILHGKRELDGLKTFYNAGTGVVPKERGQKLTSRMYEFCIPILKAKLFKQGVLEVISNNAAAIPIYKTIGFEIIRQLPCYRGIPQIDKINRRITIKNATTTDWKTFKSFWDWKPTWQNQPETIDTQAKTLEIAVAYLDHYPVGYIIYNPKTNKIHQFAVQSSHRKQNIGSSLFNHVSKGKSVSLINADGNDLQTNSFLKHLQLEQFLTQYEMGIHLNT